MTAITEEELTTIGKFSDFLKIAGPPGSGNVKRNLIDAKREDLLDWALGFKECPDESNP